MTVKINADTSDGLKFVSDTSGAIDLQSNGTTKVSLDSSGNLEVNNGNFIIDKSSSPNLLFNIDGTEKGYIRQNANDLESNSASGNVLFRTGGTERMRIDSSGNLKFNSGYGSVVTAYGVRAWVNFNGTGTVAIRASGGVSSVADRGTGKYTVVLSFHMPDNNFCGVATAIDDISSTDNRNRIANAYTEDTNDVYVNVFTTDGSLDDVEQVNVVVVR
jgi:hypothetical protein